MGRRYWIISSNQKRGNQDQDPIVSLTICSYILALALQAFHVRDEMTRWATTAVQEINLHTRCKAITVNGTGVRVDDTTANGLGIPFLTPNSPCRSSVFLGCREFIPEKTFREVK